MKGSSITSARATALARPTGRSSDRQLSPITAEFALSGPSDLPDPATHAYRKDLADAARALSEARALGGASDHGVSKSLYGQDPDGNEFEIMWRVPREAWGEYEKGGVIMPLDIDAEVARFGGKG